MNQSAEYNIYIYNQYNINFVGDYVVFFEKKISNKQELVLREMKVWEMDKNFDQNIFIGGSKICYSSCDTN